MPTCAPSKLLAVHLSHLRQRPHLMRQDPILTVSRRGGLVSGMRRSCRTRYPSASFSSSRSVRYSVVLRLRRMKPRAE